MFWATLGEPSIAARDLISLRSAKIIQITAADSFFEDLAEKVTVQAEIERPNPQTVELLIGRAKGYIQKAEYRIQLGDLIGHEVQAISGFSSSNLLDFSGRWPGAAFETNVRRCESSAERLARVFGVIGRWDPEGKGTEIRKIISILLRLAQIGDGLTQTISFRAYPSILLVYGFGLGALRAANYKQLFHTLTIPILNPYVGKELPFVVRFFGNAWEASDPGAWNTLPERRSGKLKTPLSTHLRSLFREWTKDYIYMDDEYRSLFARFEYLASLAYISVKYKKEEIRRHVNSGNSPDFVWAPLGEFAWSREGIVDPPSDEEFANAILSAGFSNGDPEELVLATKNLRNLISRSQIYWG